jgi:hypothetical protein
VHEARQFLGVLHRQHDRRAQLPVVHEEFLDGFSSRPLDVRHASVEHRERWDRFFYPAQQPRREKNTHATAS